MDHVLDSTKYPLMHEIGEYKAAKRIVKLAPKSATKWSKNNRQYMKASKHSYVYYHSSAKWVINNVLWQWDEEYTENSISINALGKEVKAYEIEHGIFDLPPRFLTLV